MIDGQGVEFMYNIYSPTVIKIEVLRLERRLDDELYYLRLVGALVDGLY